MELKDVAAKDSAVIVDTTSVSFPLVRPQHYTMLLGSTLLVLRGSLQDIKLEKATGKHYEERKHAA